jgi:acetyl-CoA carboxylase biotin carboxyl carrier protein
MSTERIQELLQLMESHELAELELEEGDFKVRLCKQTGPVMQAAALPAPTAPPATTEGVTEPAPEEMEGTVIESPIVGTFYRSPAPDADAFVKVGDRVEDETVVCIVEAMKVMNEVKAQTSGSIARILVENGDPVEFGQPLFLVKPE